MCVEAGFSQIQSHTYTIAIIANPTLNRSTYFTVALNESAINPGHFGPIPGNCTVLFVLNLISRSRDTHILFTIIGKKLVLSIMGRATGELPSVQLGYKAMLYSYRLK